MRTFVLAESRGENRTVVIEKMIGEHSNVYRVTIARRFRSLSKAQDAFLEHVPKGSRERYKNDIAEEVTHMTDEKEIFTPF